MNIGDEELCADLARAFTMLRRKFDRVMIEQGASLAQTKMLMCVKAQSGTVRAADIAEIFGLAPRTVTEALDGLERDGLIRRAPDPDDRRVKRLAITEAGEAAIGVTEPLRRKLSKDVMGVLNEPERRHFHAAMQKIIARLAEI
jgi:Transcriptional regulators